MLLIKVQSQEPGFDHHFIIIRSLSSIIIIIIRSLGLIIIIMIRSLATMQENSKLDLDSIIAKLLLSVSPNLLW